MSRRAKVKDAPTNARAKPLPAKPHQVRDGRCALCRRTGADLKVSCPGYATAADTFDRKTAAQIDPLTAHPGGDKKKAAAMKVKPRKQKGGRR